MSLTLTDILDDEFILIPASSTIETARRLIATNPARYVVIEEQAEAGRYIALRRDDLTIEQLALLSPSELAQESMDQFAPIDPQMTLGELLSGQGPGPPPGKARFSVSLALSPVVDVQLDPAVAPDFAVVVDGVTVVGILDEGAWLEDQPTRSMRTDPFPQEAVAQAEELARAMREQQEKAEELARTMREQQEKAERTLLEMHHDRVAANQVTWKDADAAAQRERRINVWVGEDPNRSPSPLRVGIASSIHFMVGETVAASVAVGPKAAVPDSDIPAEGLDTSWVVWSSDLELTSSPPGVTVEMSETGGTPSWTARFDLHIPSQGNSNAVQLIATALKTGKARLQLLIYVGAELYRQLAIAFAVHAHEDEPPSSPVVAIEGDNPRTPAVHLSVGTTHEWTTPPGTLSISIFSDMVFLRGTSMGPDAGGAKRWTTEPGQPEPWVGVASRVSGPIKNLIVDAERFRAKHESYLNDLPPDDLLSRLANPNHQYNWSNFQLRPDSAHEEAWQAVETSDELWSLAKSGRALYDRFFPTGYRLRKVLEFLPEGHRIDIDWTPQGNYVPHVPWGLLYLREVPPRGQPVDPTGFFGFRFRIGYTSHLIPGGSGKALGRLESTHGAHLIYQGDPPGVRVDDIAAEARWQRSLLGSVVNQVLVPSETGDPLTELREILSDPSPTPMAVLYLFCQSGGDIGDPLLRFGPPTHPYDLRRYDLEGTEIHSRPLVFANACTTATADPYVASLLEESFFDRGCRGYVGTETKVPITLASRFALIFFRYFYRAVVPEPISAGEAVTQTRLFLWTNYRNIGGLFYAFVNNYELFMADDEEIKALK